MMMEKLVSRRSYLRHPLTAIGAAILLASFLAFLTLVLVDMTSHGENPYRSLITFVAIPSVGLFGLVLFLFGIWWQIRKRRKTGEEVKFTLNFNPSDPRYVRNIWTFIGVAILFVVLSSFIGYKAYESTDSPQFCGEFCHTVMAPQRVTYKNSAHARVPCVECHIGEGASYLVRAKIDGIRQLWATATNSYTRPTKTPVHNLRPAQETCESCHWPRQFYGQKLLTRTYYRTNKENTPWSIDLLMKIGGGNPRTGIMEGIHWHMAASNKIEYIATDEKRHDIIWVRSTTPEGEETVYTRGNNIDPTSDTLNVRRFDCMDCHNRPSHKFLPPATAINLALSTRNISPELPYIRKEGLKLLNAEYQTDAEARDSIAIKLSRYYEEEFPEIFAERPELIKQAVYYLQTTYSENFFPEMKTDYRVRENHLSHFVNDGCFRCHDGEMRNEFGEYLQTDCQTCHLIVAQGPSEDINELEANIAGLDFRHPEDIDGMWKEMKCTECHTPDDGY